jgi:hypothetical protein
MNSIRLTGFGEQVVVRNDDGAEQLRVLLSVRATGGTDGHIEVRTNDPVIVNRFRAYAAARVLCISGKLRWADEGTVYVAAETLDYSHRTPTRRPTRGFKVFNSALPAAKFTKVKGA